ncbi:MAG: hypothetical protein LBH58_05705 [Tannerellaceae bacterium]|nr:hypothetical protein [Tannerellaceae bacterium]
MTKLDGMLDRHGYLSVDLVPENVVLLDASGRIPMAKMPNNMVTYTSDQNNNIAYNINPSLRISGGGNTELGSAVEDFVVSNIAIVDVIIATVIEAINTHESAMQAAVPIGTMCDVEW